MTFAAPVAPVKHGGALADKSFVLTGTLSMSRSEAAKKIESCGGRVKGTISKQIDYVIVGDKPGSKAAKAEKLGLSLLNEAEFLALLDQN